MLHFKISNFRRLEYAEIEIDRLTLLFGLNEQGKSSVIGAVGGLLTGDPLKYYRIAKIKKEELVRIGQNQGMIEGSNGTASASTVLPEAKITTQGAFPALSDSAVGAGYILTMTEKDRQNFIARMLKTIPSKEQFLDAIKEAHFKEQTIGMIWQTCETIGWDAAYKSRQEIGIELKGAWQQLTGEQKYGSKKADTWIPVCWQPDLFNASIETLEHETKTAQEYRDALIKTVAISESEIEQAKKMIDDPDLIDIDEKIRINKETQEAIQSTIIELKTGITNIEAYLKNDSQQCPECKTALRIETGKIVRGIKIERDKITKGNDALTLKQKMLKDNREVLVELQDEYSVLANKQHALKLAKETIGKSVGSQKPNDEQIKEADARLKNADDRLIAFKTWKLAHTKHDLIQRNDIVTKALAPDGLRGEILKSKLKDANAKLKEICEATKMRIVSIDDDLTIRYDGIRSGLTSRSGPLRINIAFQIFQQLIEPEPLIIIDDLDTLDKPSRNGLIAALIKYKIPALVAAACTREDIVMKSGGGINGYWIEAGKVVKV